MAFVTKCTGTDCPSKEKCMHYTWDSHQSDQKYFDSHPLYLDPVTGEKKCREFWPNERSDEMYRTKK